MTTELTIESQLHDNSITIELTIEKMKQYIIGNNNLSTKSDYLPGSNQTVGYLGLVLLMSIPFLGVSVYYHGIKLMLLLLTAIVPGLIIESLFAQIQKKPFNGGSVIYSLLLVLILPVSTPLWMVFTASAFATFFGKEIFGGTGYQLVNPTLLAKLFLMISYPAVIHDKSHFASIKVDAPEAWKIASILMIFGMIIFLIKNIENIYITLGIIVGTAIMIFWLNFMNMLAYESILKSIALDGYLFGVCILVFDPTGIPKSKIGKLIFGLFVSCLAFAIGTFSDKYAEGIVIAILAGNLITPLIDSLIKRKEA